MTNENYPSSKIYDRDFFLFDEFKKIFSSKKNPFKDRLNNKNIIYLKFPVTLKNYYALNYMKIFGAHFLVLRETNFIFLIRFELFIYASDQDVIKIFAMEFLSQITICLTK